MKKNGNVRIDFAKEQGEIRRLNGGNLGPRIYRPANQTAEFKELEIPITRLHDVPLHNYGMRLVDVHHIFGNFKADAQDPDNYYFPPTDDYLKKIIAGGSQILYRLGTSIEHTERNYFAYPPADYEKWADICVNIIRHYNEGWNNGFNFRILYWEIWNEADGGGMWNSTVEEYCKLYEAAAKKIKARFPYVKIGGPAVCNIHNYSLEWTKKFLAYCRDHHLPLDFFSWHNYNCDPQFVIDDPQRARDLLDRYGYTDTELSLNEWHYWDRSSSDPSKNYINGRHNLVSARAAVHAMAVLTGWQDSPLDMGCFYTIGSLDWTSSWGAWKQDDSKSKLFHAFKAFANLARHKKRVEASSDTKDVRVLAGFDDQGEGAAMISDFVTECAELSVKIEGADISGVQAFCLDEEHDMDPVSFKVKNGRIVLPTPAKESSVWLLTGLKKKA